MVRILGFHSHGLSSIPGQGSEILQAVQHGQKKKEKKRKRERETSRVLKICLEHMAGALSRSPKNSNS